MSDESPNPSGDSLEEKPEDEQAEPSTLDREIITRLRNKRPIAWIIALGIIVLAVIGFANKIIEQGETLRSHIDPPKVVDTAAFNVRIHSSIQSLIPMFFVAVDYGDFKACAAPIILNMTITNLQQYPATIFNYKAEALDANDKWVNLPRIPIGKNFGVYAFTRQLGPEHAVGFAIEPGPLDTQLKATSSLAPHVPLVGSAFFDDPLQYEFTHVRVTVRDTLNHVYTSEPINLHGVRDASVFSEGFTLDAAEHKLFDLTKHPLNYHCGR